MPSDRARVTYDATRKWRGLIAQQGRVTVEADWNEATAIDLERDRQLTLDFVGPVGTPSIPAPGYVVTVVSNADGDTGGIPGDLTIGEGTIYVGGERLDLDRPVTYSTQPEWLDSSTSPLWIPPGAPGAGVTELVYLLASEQEVSAVEDPSLADVALGGPDTMQRLRLIQRFVRQPVTQRLVHPELRPAPPEAPGPRPAGPILPNISILRHQLEPPWWTELKLGAPAGTFSGLILDASRMTLVSTAGLQVSFAPASGSNGAGPTQLDAGAGYLGAENQLIRVMVASAPAGAAPHLVWGFDDASFIYRVHAELDSSTKQITLTLESPPIDSYHNPAAGQAVELLRDEVWLSGQDYIASPNGFVSTVITGYDPTTRTVVIGDAAVDGSALPTDYLPPTGVSAPPAPEIDTLTPSAGPIAGGTPVTVTGSGFTGATAVNFGTTPAPNLLVHSDTELTVITPGVSDTATVQVVVVTPLGTSNTSPFDYLTPAAPTITGVSPNTGVLEGGTLVTIQGSGFTGATEVDFGASAGAGLTVASDASLTVVTPAASAGEVTVTVITPQGNATAQYTSAAESPPQVTAVSPASGPLAGGTVVTVTGTGFTGATEVDFGAGNPGTGLSVLSDTELTVVSPAAPGPGNSTTVDVTVKNAAGASPPASGDRFAYELEVTGVSPTIGPPTGGTVVTVTGTGFTGATSVRFGKVPGTALNVQSDTQLTVTSPPGGGSVPVVVSAPGGFSADTAAARFSYAKTPQLYLRVWQGLAHPAQAAPAASTGPYVYSLDGTGITVALSSSSGQFHVGDFWRFALRPLQPSAVYPARYLTAPQPPDGPRTWICPLALLSWNEDGTAGVTSNVPVFWNLATITDAIINHVVLPKPVVSTVSPNSGPPSGGTLVTVTGSGFTGATTVYFGPTTNPGTGLSVANDNQLTVTSPAGTGLVDVRVITAGGESDANAAADQFAYIGITSVSPALGPPAGGSAVTLTGSGFTGATAVDFGGNPGTNLNVVSDTEITVTSPAGNGLVPVTVTVGQHVSQPTGDDLFAYINVTSITPTGGPEAGGTQVTVTGVGFVSVESVGGVAFGPFTTSNFQVVNDTTIVVTAPPGSGVQPVAVLTPLGNTAIAGFTPPQFTYQGKNIVKDTKDLDDHKSRIIDKTHDKAQLAEKIVDNRPVFPQVAGGGGHPALERAAAEANQAEAEAKQAEAKPPEVAGGAGPAVPGQAVDARGSGEAEAEQGHAFIEPDERPEVGGNVVAEDDAEGQA